MANNQSLTIQNSDLYSGVEEEKKRVAQSRNRDRNWHKFDKDRHPLVKSGHYFRQDHMKIYKIHAALKGCTRQELINQALEYYRVNVLQKSGTQKLIESGQEQLEI